MGSPEFAVPSLRVLAAAYTVVGVVTQPDRPAGRGRKLQPSAVRTAAAELEIPTITPQRLQQEDALQQLREWQPAVIVVAAFGQILKPAVLELPAYGCVNVHASLLPRHRGAAPVAAAILAGDEKTGITMMKMDPGLDTGPILAQRSIAIQPAHTGGTLTAALAELGATLISDTLPEYLSGAISPQPQDEAYATYAPRLKKIDGRIDWKQSAETIARQVRALHPWPGTFAMLAGQPMKIRAAITKEGTAPPGAVVASDTDIAVGTGEDLLQLEIIQPAGKRAMQALDYLRGAPDFAGALLA